jgi:hypothetical protein
LCGAAGVACCVVDELIGGEEVEVGEFAGGEEFVREEGGGFVGGEAAIFLKPLFFVDAFGADAGEEIGPGFVAARFLVDALNQALVDGFLEWEGVEAPAHGIAIVGDFADELIEEGVGAAVGGDDGEVAAPGGDGLGHAVEEALIFVQGEFVEFNVAAFAGEGIGVGREAVDAAAVGEFEDVGGEVVAAIEDHFAEVEGGQVDDAGPVFAILEIESGLGFVAGRDPDIEPCVGVAGAADGIIGIGVGDADLAGFLDDFEWGIVGDPGDLGG